jgi:hypothetical protein
MGTMNETSDMDVSYFFATHITCSTSVRSVCLLLCRSVPGKKQSCQSLILLESLAGQIGISDLSIEHVIFLPV